MFEPKKVLLSEIPFVQVEKGFQEWFVEIRERHHLLPCDEVFKLVREFDSYGEAYAFAVEFLQRLEVLGAYRYRPERQQELKEELEKLQEEQRVRKEARAAELINFARGLS